MLDRFNEKPLCVPLCISTIHTVPKGMTEYRMIGNLSFPKGKSINADIPKGIYLGEPGKL